MTEGIYYSFIKLNLAQFATFEFNPGELLPIELSSSFGFAYSFEDGIVCCTSDITLNQGSAPVLKAELNSYFKLQPESVLEITDDDGSLILPVSLMTQFASLCYGSMRGVIYAKTMGTALENMVLPPCDVQQIFTSPARFTK